MDARDVALRINGVDVEVPEGTTILQAARTAGYEVPSLCFHPDLKPNGTCGMCVVEIEGVGVRRSCCTPVEGGMSVLTGTPRVMDTRRTLIELILADHAADCPICDKHGKCDLQRIAQDLGIREIRIPGKEEFSRRSDGGIVLRDPNKCILCNRCVSVCTEVQGVANLTRIGRGYHSKIGTAFDLTIEDSVCVNCGQCVVYCPVGALSSRDDTREVRRNLADPRKHVVVQEAPAIRAALGEEFGLPPGLIVSGRMHAALRKLGFDRVFDTNFAADVCILEEGTEVVERIVSGSADLPVITSCSPGWIKFMETFYPGLGRLVSTAKSPQQMFGALAKTYYARESGIDPSDIVSVSVMPCTAKKFEADRPEMRSSGFKDVDYVLTTRELARMIKESGIRFEDLEDAPADELMGSYTGAATIFGATGGVMEAALRTAYHLVTGGELENLDILPVRGMEGVKEAVVPLPLPKGGTLDLKVAVAHGLGNARKILDVIRGQLAATGKSDYHFVEIMACPGGCVGGGGQPFGSTLGSRAERGAGLYGEDRSLPTRKSHENPAVLRLYETFLGSPCSEKAHHLLHTSYVERERVHGRKAG